MKLRADPHIYSNPGLALGIREQETEWEVEDADAVADAIPARYRITYRTFAADLSIQG